jgi:hypothetical protein
MDRPIIRIGNDINKFFSDYFFVDHTDAAITSEGPEFGRFKFKQRMYGQRRSISNLPNNETKDIFSLILTGGKSNRATTQEIDQFLSGTFKEIDRQTQGGALTSLTSTHMPKGVIRDTDYSASHFPRNILFTAEDTTEAGRGGAWYKNDSKIVAHLPRTDIIDPATGEKVYKSSYATHRMQELLRHEHGHAISDAFEMGTLEEFARQTKLAPNDSASVVYAKSRDTIMGRMRSAISDRSKRSLMLADAIEQNAATRRELFQYGTLSSDITKDLRIFGELASLSSEEKRLVHTVMGRHVGGEGRGFGGMLSQIVEESFADDFSVINAPRVTPENFVPAKKLEMMPDGTYRQVEEGLGVAKLNSIQDYLDRMITDDFTQSGYGRTGGTQWDNYLGRHFGTTLSEEETKAMKKFSTEIYTGSRTTGLVSVGEMVKTAHGEVNSRTIHLPAVRSLLEAQGYSMEEISPVIENMQKRAKLSKELIDSGRIDVPLLNLVEEEAPKSLDLARNMPKAVMSLPDPVQGRPIIKMDLGPPVKPAQRTIGQSSAGRAFFREAVDSAKGSRVIEAAGKAIRSVF